MDDKQRLIRFLKAGEETCRQTGRTTAMIEAAVECLIRTREPVAIVAFSKDEAARMLQVARDLLFSDWGRDRCLISSNGATPDTVAPNLKATAHVAVGPDTHTFVDHTVWLQRGIEAIEAL